ncbi:hypothetical protein [Flavobacterium yafengii]|uniref:hypothetical protein n=1 Tax=Flavobacterium yafengii TaxID=3041253 RepID=UPI0024A81CBD|nr:hypothetical protein [Flavobacterium yafengii]MDI5887618.1 hypothetical protein [Flavobacterium yafengii]
MKTINKIMLFALAIVTMSCEDILEEDITNDSALIMSPLNDSKVESNVVKFQWNSLKGADNYRVQIYGANQSIVLDSLVSKTNLTYPLKQGTYQWRVRGENFAYQSSYSFPATFSTVISEDLTNQQVILSSPQNDIYVNFTNITLNWQSLPNATSYSVEVINVTNGQQIYQNSAITGISATLNIPSLADGIYEWRVKAKNGTTETLQYAGRKFSIDTVIANQPQNVTPANNSIQTINQQVSFTWTIATDSGTVQAPISYKIEFSNNENFTTISQTSNASSTTFQQTFSTAGIYFWRIKAVDLAGNVSVASAPYKFTIN